MVWDEIVDARDARARRVRVGLMVFGLCCVFFLEESSVEVQVLSLWTRVAEHCDLVYIYIYLGICTGHRLR